MSSLDKLWDATIASFWAAKEANESAWIKCRDMIDAHIKHESTNWEALKTESYEDRKLRYAPSIKACHESVAARELVDKITADVELLKIEMEKHNYNWGP